MRIGIYGGSFNPVHNGHIHLARTVAGELELDMVYLVPSRISPHRSVAEYASPEDRVAMLRIAAQCDERLRVSTYELDADRVSYSIYTVEHFRRKFPEAELFLLIGSDMLLSFDTWYRYQDIMRQVTLAVVSRENGDTEQLEEKAAQLRSFGEVVVSHAGAVEVSSTEIRKKIAKNLDFTCYIDENVVQYIRQKGLYGA